MKAYKSVVAKLLATENIEVREGNYQTASFAVDKRILRLPILTYDNPMINDLYIGHEVGHALYTPLGWYDFLVAYPHMQRILNIIEDVRIEKLIKRKYPGLLVVFTKGYKDMLRDNAFKIKNDKGEVLKSFSLLDKINLKAKCENSINIVFSKKEKKIVEQVFAVETWEDAVKATLDFYEWIQKEKKRKEQKNEDTRKLEQDGSKIRIEDAGYPEQPEENRDSNDIDDTGEGGDGGEDYNHKITIESESVDEDFSKEEDDNSSQGEEAEEAERTQGMEQGESGNGSEDGTESGTSEGTGEGSTGEDEDGDGTEGGSSSEEKADDARPGLGEDEVDEFQSITADALDAYKKNFNIHEDDKDWNPIYIKPLSEADVDKVVISYKDIIQKRRSSSPRESSAFINYYKGVKPIINVMLKEFEIRKAGTSYARAQVHKTGSIDTTKIYSYKYTDDIFKKVTNLANAKNHGLIMYIDFSGSMHAVISDVINQTIIITSFCKKAGIPFEVYSYTASMNSKLEKFKDMTNTPEEDVGEINMNGMLIINQLSSSMSLYQFNMGIEQLYRIGHNIETGGRAAHKVLANDFDAMGSTPLLELAMMMPHLMRKFQKKYSVEKINSILISDGSPSEPDVKIPQVRVGKKHSAQSIFGRPFMIKLNDKIFNYMVTKPKRDENGRLIYRYEPRIISESEQLVTDMISDTCKKFGASNTCFYIVNDASSYVSQIYKLNKLKDVAAGRWDVNNDMYRNLDSRILTTAKQKGHYLAKDVVGYNNYFIYSVISAKRSKSFRNRNRYNYPDKPVVKESLGDIKKQFMKEANNKKKRRLFAEKFIESIA